MKGAITAFLIWALAISPLLFARKNANRAFLHFSYLVGFIAIVLLVATVYFGYGITENVTTSLGGTYYLHKKGAPFKKGDFIAYYWHGGATYPSGTIFIKRVIGIPGDIVVRRDRDFWVDGRYVGFAKEHSRAGVPLKPSPSGIIRKGEYFVTTPNPDSLDSRYELSGNIKDSEIIGRAYALF